MKLNTAFRPTRDDLREFWTDSPAQAPGKQQPPCQTASQALEGITFANNLVCDNVSTGSTASPVKLEDMPTEQLRDLASRTGYSILGWEKWDRPMLIAFHRNRTLRRSQDAAIHE